MSEWIKTSDPRRPGLHKRILMSWRGDFYQAVYDGIVNGAEVVRAEVFHRPWQSFDYWLPIPPLPTEEVTNG